MVFFVNTTTTTTITTTGKSTTLRAIAGMLPLKAGTRQTGDGLNMGIFTQDLAQGNTVTYTTLLLS
jgi:ATPase subunit of ABC transporter with duplicated ATPase domains